MIRHSLRGVLILFLTLTVLYKYIPYCLMKSAFGELADKLKAVNKGLKPELMRIVKKHKETLILLNQEQLYDFGVDNKGKRLKKYTSDKYAKRKARMNPRTSDGVPDLFLSGDLFESMDARFVSGEVQLLGKTSYVPYLIERYGDDIFGVTDANLEGFTMNVIYPDLLKWIISRL